MKDETKKCKTCEQKKPLIEFSFNSYRARYQAGCKKCRAIEAKRVYRVKLKKTIEMRARGKEASVRKDRSSSRMHPKIDDELFDQFNLLMMKA